MRKRIFAEVSAGTFGFPPRGYGGGERFAFGLAKALSEKLRAIIIDFGGYYENGVSEGVRIVRLRNPLRLEKGYGLLVYSWNAFTASVTLVLALVKGEIRLDRPILYFYNGLEYSIFRHLQVALLPNLQPVYVFRLQSPKWMDVSLLAWWHKALAIPTELYAISTADIAIFESEAVRDSVRRYCRIPTRYFVFPNAVDTDVFCKERYISRSKPNRILYAARIKRQKNQLAVVRAMATVVKEEPNAKLLLLGDPDEIDYYRKIRYAVSRLGIESDVEFHPSVTVEELNMIRAEYPIHIIYSDYTGFDVAVGETLAMAAACIFSDIPALRGFVEDGVNCILVPPNNADRLARVMIELLRNPARVRQLSEEARRTAISRLSWKVLANNFLDYVNQLT